jgi:type I restriction enzyme S subunit
MKKGWQTKRLGDLIELISGQHIDSKDYNTSGRGVGYLTGPSDFGPIYPIITKWTEHPKIKAKKNDILITVKGSGVGKVNLMDADEVAISRQLMAIRVVNAERQFVYLLLESVFDHFQEESTGAAIPGISREQVLGLEIPVPPLSEQQRIVGLLDEAFASLATAQAHAAQNLQNARDIFESHLNAVFTQRGKGWVEKTLGDICDFVGGSQPPKAVFSKTKTPNSIRLIQIRDYKSDNHVVYIPKAQARRFCTVDDIMIGRYGPPIFQILRGLEGAYNVALMKAVPDEAQVNREFLFYFLKHPAILEYVIYHSERAAGQIGVTKETLAPYPIAMPSLDKQVTVAANINALAAETQQLTRIYEQKLAALAELKKSLLHQAFSGEL